MNANQTLLNEFITRHPFAAAQAIERLSPEEIAAYFETLPVAKSTALLNFMDPHKAVDSFVLLSPDKTKEIVEKGNIQLIASMLRNVSKPQRKKLLSSVSSERADTIYLQLEALPNTIVYIMETALIVTKHITVVDVQQLLKKNNGSDEIYLYVVDLDGVFLGIVRSKELFLASPNDLIEELMISGIQTFLKDTPTKSIVEHPVWQEYQEIPILDTSNKLLGKVTHRNLLKSTFTPSKISSSEIAETGSAIGELYRIGLTGLLQGGGK